MLTKHNQFKVFPNKPIGQKILKGLDFELVEIKPTKVPLYHCILQQRSIKISDLLMENNSLLTSWHQWVIMSISVRALLSNGINEHERLDPECQQSIC